MGIPCVLAAYCPTVLPSPRHAPPVLAMGDKPASATADHRELWEQDARRWNGTWGPLLNWPFSRLAPELVVTIRTGAGRRRQRYASITFRCFWHFGRMVACN